MGWSARKPLPSPLRPLAYRAFARAVGANLDEVELELEAYPSLGDFFARRLRSGARTIDPAPDTVIAPCDGVIAARGYATGGTLIQAKGRDYRLEELLADDALAGALSGGAYVTVYLSPRDYHRVHAPVAGTLVGYDYLPGALWPVNPRVAARRDALLARNERVVIHLNSPRVGRVAVVMVGASGVGNISLVHGFDSATLRGRGERRRVELQGIEVARGDELGAFHLGSTTIVVFEPGAVELLDGPAGDVGQPVRFGERLAQTQHRGRNGA
ncbi:MAG: phosphatidylserine decarboxylase [Deltaproteobacteria bacterium]|nr:phosphatidylserine decarboxylase [Deltaproteobacteria bacterium]MCW5808737.1 phosphatidylserine decarboxylase [Deltaproteobacteria bacterium]